MMENTAATTPAYRPAEDIAENIAALVRAYPPLMHSRHTFSYNVAEGVVTLKGHIKSVIAERVLLDNVPHIPGVEAVEAKELYNDEALRMAVARVIPAGILVNIDSGYVHVSGMLPPRRKPEALVKKIEDIKGVRGVNLNLW